MPTPTVAQWLSTWASGATVATIGVDEDLVEGLRGARPGSLAIVGSPKVSAREGTETSVPLGKHRAASVDLVVLFAPVRGAGRAVAEARRLLRPKGFLAIVAVPGDRVGLKGVRELLREAAAEFELGPPDEAQGVFAIAGPRRSGRPATAGVEDLRGWLDAALALRIGLGGARERVEHLGAEVESAASLLAAAEEDVENVRAVEERARRRLERQLEEERLERGADVDGLVEARRELFELEAELREALAERAATVAELEKGVAARRAELEEERRELREVRSRLDSARETAEVERERAEAERGKVEAADTELIELRGALDAARRAASEVEREALAPDSATAEPSDAWRDWMIDELIGTQRRLAFEIGRNAELMSGRTMRAQQEIWRMRQSRRARFAGAAFVLVLGVALVAALYLLGGLAAVLGAVVLGSAALASLYVLAGRDRPEAPLPRVPALSHATRLPDRDAVSAPAPAEVKPAPVVAEQTAAPVVDLERRRWMARLDRTVGPVTELRVAGIADEITTSCLAPDCDWKAVQSEWGELFESWRPDILFVESAWSGNEGQWQYQVCSYDHPTYRGLPQLRKLLDWCDANDVPTVFWNKEDPVHFDRFKEAAALFKHVFTTDANRIDAYRELGGRTETVDALPFAAQPLIHNPTRLSAPRSKAPCFAGTYYNDRHSSRRQSLEALLDAALPSGLVIYDRMHGASGDQYAFPERFRSHVVGRLPYDRLIDVYKGHDIFLNVNSVVDSPTMFSRRVFELLACDTAVLSTESAGVRAIFGETVPIAESFEEASTLLAAMSEDLEWRTGLVRQARRHVLREHTYRRRLETVARRCGIEVAVDPDLDTACLVILDEGSPPQDVENLLDDLRSQRGAVREVIVGVAGVDAGLGEVFADGDNRVRVVRQESLTPTSERYRELAQIATTPWVVPVAPGARLGPHHIEDLAICVRFADADIIGGPIASGPEETADHTWVWVVEPNAALVRRDLVVKRGWTESSEAGERMARWFSEGVRIYAADAPTDADRESSLAGAYLPEANPATPRVVS